MSAERDFFLTYFPQANPLFLASEIHGDIKIDVFAFDSSDNESDEYAIVSELRNGKFIPLAVTDFRHIPYDPMKRDQRPPSTDIGVFVAIESIHEPQATKLLLRYKGADLEKEIIGGRAVQFCWDTVWPDSSQQPKPVALYVRDHWVPTLCTGVAATADTFYHASYNYRLDHQKKDYEWAADCYFGFSREEKFEMLIALVERVPEHDSYIGYLGAGPVEDLMGDELLDFIEKDVANRAKWKAIIKTSHYDFEQGECLRRIKKLLAGPA